jgi:hypothetical protein
VPTLIARSKSTPITDAGTTTKADAACASPAVLEAPARAIKPVRAELVKPQHRPVVDGRPSCSPRRDGPSSTSSSRTRRAAASRSATRRRTGRSTPSRTCARPSGCAARLICVPPRPSGHPRQAPQARQGRADARATAAAHGLAGVARRRAGQGPPDRQEAGARADRLRARTHARSLHVQRAGGVWPTAYWHGFTKWLVPPGGDSHDFADGGSHGFARCISPLLFGNPEGRIDDPTP